MRHLVGVPIGLMMQFALVRYSTIKRTEAIAKGIFGEQVCRTRLIDDTVRAAFSERAEQLAILGAGFDPRPYRLLGLKPIKTFEVDLPAVQSRKKSRIQSLFGRPPERCGHRRDTMAGKAGSAYKGKLYRNYYCSRAMHSREQCAFYNGHSAAKLEKAIIDYLGQFSAPGLVKEYLAAADRKELETREAELRDIEKQLADSESGFLKKLDDLLRRNLATEAQFARANQAEKKRDRTSLAEELPHTIGSFLEAFESLDIRQQKAHLHTILKAAYVYTDGRIELEFRE